VIRPFLNYRYAHGIDGLEIWDKSSENGWQMAILLDFISQNWRDLVVPIAVFSFCLTILLLLRKLAFNRISRWLRGTKWPSEYVTYEPVKYYFLILCIVMSTCLGLAWSSIPDEWKTLTERILWTLFVITIVLVVSHVFHGLILYAIKRLRLIDSTSAKIWKITRVVILAVSLLVTLDVWGVPTGPLLLLIAVAAMLILLALRDAAPNFFAGFQIHTWQYLKVGDSIRLENGEEGCITQMGWSNTHLQTAKGDYVIIPNSQLTRQKVVKKDVHPEKQAQANLSEVLTERELEIAKLITLGITNKEIAQQLFITENTAKVHVKNILKKLELKNRQQVAVYTTLNEGTEAGTSLNP
jgi:small-conductance mechanosensitive channel